MDKPAVAAPTMPLLGPTNIKTSIVATEITVARLPGCVALQIVTPTGVQFYFMDPEQARATGEGLISAASAIVPAPRPSVDLIEVKG